MEDERTPTVCAICGETGGRFTLRGENYVHTRSCDPNFVANPDKAKSLFPYTTDIIDGHPTEVQSLRHLRQLERQHGVVSEAFNNNESNWRHQ